MSSQPAFPIEPGMPKDYQYNLYLERIVPCLLLYCKHLGVYIAYSRYEVHLLEEGMDA